MIVYIFAKLTNSAFRKHRLLPIYFKNIFQKGELYNICPFWHLKHAPYSRVSIKFVLRYVLTDTAGVLEK